MTSVLLCMWFFKPEALTQWDVTSLGLWGLGFVLGPIMGVWIGDAVRKEIHKEAAHKDPE